MEGAGEHIVNIKAMQCFEINVNDITIFIHPSSITDGEDGKPFLKLQQRSPHTAKLLTALIDDDDLTYAESDDRRLIVRDIKVIQHLTNLKNRKISDLMADAKAASKASYVRRDRSKKMRAAVATLPATVEVSLPAIIDGDETRVIVKATPKAGRNHGTYVLLTEYNIGRLLAWVAHAHVGDIDEGEGIDDVNDIDEAGDDVDDVDGDDDDDEVASQPISEAIDDVHSQLDEAADDEVDESAHGDIDEDDEAADKENVETLVHGINPMITEPSTAEPQGVYVQQGIGMEDAEPKGIYVEQAIEMENAENGFDDHETAGNAPPAVANRGTIWDMLIKGKARES